MIQAKIIADTTWPRLPRLTTMQLRYPRFIHAEFLTHRVFSRNASSSRAIPVRVMMKQVLLDPAIPVSFGKNKKGMQAGKPLSKLRSWIVRQAWLKARYPVLAFAWIMLKAGVHKQVANRVLEPWQYISVVVTATDWANFFQLRCHKDADPTIQQLAGLMHDAYASNRPIERDCHLPYLDHRYELSPKGKAKHTKLSTARCARVSYNNHDGTPPSLGEDLDLFDRLIDRDPPHASPTEHQAFAPSDKMKVAFTKPMGGNLKGWVQHRKLIEAGWGDRLEDLLS